MLVLLHAGIQGMESSSSPAEEKKHQEYIVCYDCDRAKYGYTSDGKTWHTYVYDAWEFPSKEEIAILSRPYDLDERIKDASRETFQSRLKKYMEQDGMYEGFIGRKSTSSAESK